MVMMQRSGDRAVPAAAPRPSIDDVARAAGVSRQTVSNVVRGRGRLGDATRRRVVAAIEQLGYQPHAGAASLRSGRTYRIAHPIPETELHPDNVIMLEFLQYLVAEARQRKHQILVSGSSLEAIADLVRTKSVDGFVLATMTGHDPRVEFLAERQFPFACFGRTDSQMPQHWVDIDNRIAVRDVTENVLARGHTRVAYLGYNPQGPWDTEREAGYRDAVAAAGLPAEVIRTGMAQTDVEATVAALLQPSSRPTGVITGSDVLAAACYVAASRTGIRIGPDLAVTGFDGSALSRILAPALTTVAMPLAVIASRLIDRVIAEAAGTPQDGGEIFAATVIGGQSV
jgi:DNA-binding LacI/PurR family transcriptional regulator